MESKYIKPEDLQRMQVDVAQYVKEARARSRLVLATVAFLAVWRGKRVDKRIAAALQEHLQNKYLKPVSVFYERDKSLSPMRPDRFKLDITLARRTSEELHVNLSFEIDFTTDHLASAADAWKRVAAQAEAVNELIPELPAIAKRYNAAQQAVKVALAPLLSQNGGYVVHPFSDFFKW